MSTATTTRPRPTDEQQPDSDLQVLWYIPNQVRPGHRGDAVTADHNSLDTLTSQALALEDHGWDGALLGTGWGRPDTFTVATALAARTTTFQPLVAIRPGYWRPAHFAVRRGHARPPQRWAAAGQHRVRAGQPRRVRRHRGRPGPSLRAHPGVPAAGQEAVDRGGRDLPGRALPGRRVDGDAADRRPGRAPAPAPLLRRRLGRRPAGGRDRGGRPALLGRAARRGCATGSRPCVGSSGSWGASTHRWSSGCGSRRSSATPRSRRGPRPRRRSPRWPDGADTLQRRNPRLKAVGQQRLLDLAERGDVLDDNLYTAPGNYGGGGAGTTWLVGSAEDVAASLRRYQELGITHFVLSDTPYLPRDPASGRPAAAAGPLTWREPITTTSAPGEGSGTDVPIVSPHRRRTHRRRSGVCRGRVP